MSLSNPDRLTKVRDFSVNGIAFCVARTPGTGRLYFGSSDFNLYEVDALAEKPEPRAFEAQGHQSYVTGVALNGHRLVSGAYDGRLIWWNTQTRQIERTVDQAHQLWIRRFASSPDGLRVASVADDMQAKVWDVESGDLLLTLNGHQPLTPHHYPSMLYAVTFSPDGQWLATGDKTGRIVVWEAQTGRIVAELEAPIMYTWDPRQRRHSIGGIRSLAFSHDSKLLAAGGIGKIGNIDHLGGPSRVEIFDWQRGERTHEIEDEKLKGLVEQLAFDPSGRWLLAAGGDHGGFVTFYDADTGKVIRQEKAPMHVHQFAMNEECNELFAVGHGKIAHYTFQADRPAGPGAPPVPETA